MDLHAERDFSGGKLSNMRPRIFIGSSREAIDVCRAVQQELSDQFDVTVWDQDVFRLSFGALDSLLETLDSSDAGIFVLRSDDLALSRGSTNPAVRDNVIFELGMFIGRLGRERTFMLSPRGDQEPRLPSDLLGITTAQYSLSGHGGRLRAAVGPACTLVRNSLAQLDMRLTPEPGSQRRLDRAMSRLGRDLETILEIAPDGPGDEQVTPSFRMRIGRATVQIEFGRIEDCPADGSAGVIVLPANEYFDDECVTDPRSAIGAFVGHHFRDRLDDFLAEVHEQTAGLPSRRVPRADRRIGESFGIGQAIYLHGLQPHQLVLVSATTERVGIGLRAEPHFLYAAVHGAIERMNEQRLSSFSMPVLGSGHGGMPLAVAILFNLLALRSALTSEIGRHVRTARVIVFEKQASEIDSRSMRAIIDQVRTQMHR